MTVHHTASDFLATIQERNAGQPEFMQAVTEVVTTLWPFLDAHPEYRTCGLLERLLEPERIIIFRVSWVDDTGNVRVNRGFRVQHSSAIGPYKGGLRFHPSVNLSIMKFLAFEQTLKNALTTLPMGGGKGGSDFDPKGRSEAEIMRFCQAYMTELHRHIGAHTDVPAGDIGVSGREIGFMVGMMKKLSNSTDCVFTGKGLSFGGSLIRPESTGFGTVYFMVEMLKQRQMGLDGMRVAISGAGNVALNAARKCVELGARVLTLSDSTGSLIDPSGLTHDKLDLIADFRERQRLRLGDAAAEIPGSHYLHATRPWSLPVDIALPCATQNELDHDDAATLIRNGVIAVAEGANMPSTIAAINAFESAGVMFAPGKASNAGGVATSGLEMTQNAMRMSWSRDEVDSRLRVIMQSIHKSCLRHGQRPDGRFSYVTGANVAGFVKVADAMRAQGVI